MTQPYQQQQPTGPTADDLIFGSGGPKVPTVKFENAGDYIDGTLVKTGAVPEWEFQDEQARAQNLPKIPKFKKDGVTQRYQMVLDLQTSLRDPADPEDTGVRRVYVKSLQMREEISKAVVANSPTAKFQMGARLFIRLEREEFAPVRKKFYSVAYVAPADVALQPEQQPAYAPPVQQATYQPPAQQQALQPGQFGYQQPPIQQATYQPQQQSVAQQIYNNPPAQAPVQQPVQQATYQPPQQPVQQPVQQQPAPVQQAVQQSVDPAAVQAAIAAAQASGNTDLLDALNALNS